MAKTYRTIKFTYNSNTYQIDIPLLNESTTREEFSSKRRTIDGTLYKQYTTNDIKISFSYNFDLCDEDVFNFFYDAYQAFVSGYDIIFSFEVDDGSFEDINAIINLPQYGDDNIGVTGKVYNNFSVEVFEI